MGEKGGEKRRNEGTWRKFLQPCKKVSLPQKSHETGFDPATFRSSLQDEPALYSWATGREIIFPTTNRVGHVNQPKDTKMYINNDIGNKMDNIGKI